MNDDARISHSTGKTWTAKGWHDFGFDVFKNASTLDAEGQFLTGMMEEGDKSVRGTRKASFAAYVRSHP